MAMTAREMTGGCQCGRIRYAAAVEGDEAYLCHCGMCRRATGGVAAAFANVARSAVRWSAEPDWFDSSPIAGRPFCAACGTPLGFAYRDGDRIDLTIGSFDEPGFFRPTSQFAIERALPAWQDSTHLPGKRIADHAPLVDRWIKAVGKLPD